jgi:hypothetical protein
LPDDAPLLPLLFGSVELLPDEPHAEANASASAAAKSARAARLSERAVLERAHGGLVIDETTPRVNPYGRSRANDRSTQSADMKTVL